MIDSLSQNTDSISFLLKEDTIGNINTIFTNDFLSYEYQSLDSCKLFFDINKIGESVSASGLEGATRPFLGQIGNSLFIFFVILFVLGAIVFKISGFSHFKGLRNLLSFDNYNVRTDNEPITTTDAWSKFFYIVQTFLMFSLLFSFLVVTYSGLHFSSDDYLILYAQLLTVFFLFVAAKYLFYKLLGNVFSHNKMNTLTDAYLSMFYLLGILNFLPIISFIYIPETRPYVLFVIIAIFLIARLVVIIQSYIFFIKVHIGNSYFFVYLCAIEIMPYLLLYKAVVLIS